MILFGLQDGFTQGFRIMLHSHTTVSSYNLLQKNYKIPFSNNFLIPFIGQIVLNTSLPHKSNKTPSIFTIKPIAVSLSETANFSVKGFDFSWSTSRLTCVLEGNHLIQTNCSDVMDGEDSSIMHDHLQSLTFSCSVPNIYGRGFIEVNN